MYVIKHNFNLFLLDIHKKNKNFATNFKKVILISNR